MSSAQNQSPRDTGSGASQAPPSGDAPRQGDAPKQYVPRPAPHYESTTGAGPSAARGLTIVAAVLMLLSGTWNFLEGLAAVIKGSYFISLPNYAYDISVRSWGWFHLILGAVVFLVGCALFTDSFWARMAGVVVAGVSTIVNFIYIPYSPVWSVAVIIIDLVILWALLSPRRTLARK